MLAAQESLIARPAARSAPLAVRAVPSRRAPPIAAQAGNEHPPRRATAGKPPDEQREADD